VTPFSQAIRSVRCRRSGAVVWFALFAMLPLEFCGCNGLTASARNAQGVRLYQQARLYEALQQFQEATYADPTNADGYYNLAATYHRLGLVDGRQTDLDQAENYYNLCLDREANHREGHRGLAVLLAEQGRQQEAFRLLEGWADHSPGSADAKIELARLFEEFNDKQAAKQHLIEAVAIDSTNPRALAALGKLREETGEQLAALADYQRSYAHDRFQPHLAVRIAALQSQMGPAARTIVPGSDTRLVRRASAALR